MKVQLTLLFIGTVASQPLAGQPMAQRAPNDSSTTPQLTVADLDVFLEGLVPIELKRHGIAGAVISVVKDGQLLFAKGYGYSDVARKTTPSPETTVFRVASISKLLNATAVMQLVEQGKLDLDQEIDTYLDFKVPRKFPDKITLRHLLTHTAGFEESFKQLPADSGKGVPLRDAAMKKTPAQIYRPGTVTSYSNYGVDLSGYIVERVSGVPFAEYVRLNILAPLGMTRSSFAEPLPPDLKALISKEYGVASDSVGKFEILQGEPSGNLSSTAVDMAKFAIAHLQLGRFGDQRILREETARSMATTQFRTQPEINGMGLGFFEESRNGYRIIGHGGDLSRFHSHLSLLMDEGVGFFFSQNSAGTGGIYGVRESVRDAFLDRYFPRRTPLQPVVPDPKAEASRVVGAYTLSRRGETSLGRVLGLAIPLNVEANEDGSIQIPFLTGVDSRPARWYPIAPLRFRNADGSEEVGFVTDSSGRVVRMAFLGGHELHRIGMTDSRPFNAIVGLGSIAVFLGTLILWPIAGAIRRRYGQPLADSVGRRLRVTARVVSLVNLLFLLGIVLFMYLGFSERITPDSRNDPLLIGIRLVGLIGVIGAIPLVLAGVRSWRSSANRVARFKYTLLAIASIGFTWFIVHWNLLGWKLTY